MVLINSRNINYTVERGGQLARSVLAKSQKLNFKGIKYAPLGTDTVEISSKTSTVGSLLDKLEQISAMRENGMTQNKIAECLGVNRGKLQGFLKKYLPDVSTEAIKFRQATKQFMSAVSSEEKNKAFEDVDEILQKIAKEKTKSNSDYAYEDCLQDLRLKFIEIVEAHKGKPRILYEQVLRTLKAEKTPDKLVKVSLSELDENALATSDLRTRIFEANGFCDELINRSELSSRQNLMVRMSIMEGKSANEIAEKFSITPTGVRGCLKEIFEKIKPKYQEVISNKYPQQHAESAQNIVNEIVARKK